jgi:hypothetical protein
LKYAGIQDFMDNKKDIVQNNATKTLNNVKTDKEINVKNNIRIEMTIDKIN